MNYCFQFNTALSECSFLSDNLAFNCSISGRTGLFDSNFVSVGLSGKIEQLNSTSSVSDFIENYFLEDFNSLIISIVHSWLACKGHSVTSYFLEFSTIQYSVLRGNA